MSDESLTLQRVETWSVSCLKEYVKKCGLPVTGSKKVLATSHSCCNQCFVHKKYKI